MFQLSVLVFVKDSVIVKTALLFTGRSVAGKLSLRERKPSLLMPTEKEDDQPQENTKTSIRAPQELAGWFSTPAGSHADFNCSVSRIQTHTETYVQVAEVEKRTSRIVPVLSPVQEGSRESYSSSGSQDSSTPGIINPFEQQFYKSMMKLIPECFWRNNPKYDTREDDCPYLQPNKVEKPCIYLSRNADMAF